jgi:hypothetical protein
MGGRVFVRLVLKLPPTTFYNYGKLKTLPSLKLVTGKRIKV